MGVNVVQLTSKNNHDNILASLHQLRLQGHLSDITVQLDHQGDVHEFQAHQVMLAASSGYFKKILLTQDAVQDKLSLSNIHYSTFSNFLEFVYMGKFEVARDKIGDVLAAAQWLDCQDLAEVCGEAMRAGIVEIPTDESSAAKVADKDDLHGAKKEKGTKRKNPPQSLLLEEQLSSESPEKGVQAKRCKVKNTAGARKQQVRKIKLSLGNSKVLQRHLVAKTDSDNDNQVSNEDTEECEDMAEVEPQPENERKEKGDECLLGADDWECEEGQRVNDPEDSLFALGEEEGEEEEEEEEEEDEQSKETFKKTSKAQFQCNKCQRTFHYERSYLKHISMYHGVKTNVIYRCETCQQTFANRSNLKIHEKHVHSTERLFSCDSCSKAFKRKKDVVRHQRQVHERNNLRHVCPQCGKALSSKTALVLHERTHTGTKPFECTDCGAKFTQNSALKMHRRIHTGEKPFACEECEARFTQKHMLTYHKRSHTGEKPFMCEACGKSFASKEYLRHHSNIHTGSKPYKCEHCGRCFAQRNSLHQHLKIHTGERPYCCKDCDKQFTQLNALQRHQRIHTGEKPYMCGLCHRTFTDKSTLRRHTMIHDSDAPWKTYLVVLEGNVEDKKPKSTTKGKMEKAGAGEKKTSAKKGFSAAATAAADSDTAGSSVKTHTDSIMLPGEPVTLPSEWTTHGAIALVSHGGAGGITVIHTDVPPGTRIQPIVTTDSTGASVISLDGSAIPVPFTLPVSMAHPVPLSSEVSTISLSVPTMSLPVSVAESKATSELDILQSAAAGQQRTADDPSAEASV